MFLAERELKTICALATGAGHSAIAIVRMSGPDSLKIITEACPGLKNKKIESHKVYLTHFKDSQLSNIDQVLITYFKFGHSYTGEESIEISSHGSPFVVQKIISRLNELGALNAEKGEFTFRAFINGQLDLIQAEAVLSVIGSQSELNLKQSLRQLEGKNSENFERYENDLTWCLAHIEASIDFSTENLEVVEKNQLTNKLYAIKSELTQTLNLIQTGRIVKDGLKVVLAGLPNVGKSSLLNLFLNENKAIVSNIAGTTRDVIESSLFYKGLKINFTDTAGLRETEDVIEKIGVAKSFSEIEKADITCFVFDLSHSLENQFNDLKNVKGKVLFLANKSDLKKDEVDYIKIKEHFTQNFTNIDCIDILEVSSLSTESREFVLNFLFNYFNINQLSDQSILTSSRQIEYAQNALFDINNTINELNMDIGYEFVSQSLKNALINIQKILGKSYDDQILDRVFKEFCLGK